MKPNHFRLVSGSGKDRQTIATLTIIGIEDISAEQYSSVGTNLLVALKSLVTDKPVSVELVSLAQDGSKPIFVYQ